MELEPIPTWVKRLWDAWNLRAMVLISLFLELILAFFGSRRKYATGCYGRSIKIIVRCAYVLADWVAIVSIGKLSDIATETKYFESNGLLLRVLWAPLLLLQFGGRDTVIAYSVKDVHYWLSIHILKLLAPAGVMISLIYIMVGHWSSDRCWLSFLTFTLMVAGITRSAERIRAVWSAKKFAHDLVNEKYDSVIIKVLHGNECCRNLPKIDFEAIDIELGFMYDKLYTKASIIYSWRGFLARLMSFICVVSVLLAFCIVSKDGYSNADINITYILLVGAVVLDIYAVILMLFSDWILVNWLNKHEKSFVSPILQALAQSPLIKKKRWSTSMVGFNLLHSCLYELKTTSFVRKFLECVGVDASQTIVDITKEETLKTMMLERVEAIASQSVELKPFYKRVEWALFEDPEKTHLKDFDDSIIIWHIATDMCYYDSVSDAQNMPADVLSKTSKMLSDYMMYLVVKRPNMLPIMTWHSMYDTTRNFFKQEFQNRGRNWLLSIAEHQACKTLLEEAKNCSSRDLPAESALAHACDLARRLEACPDKWNIISDEWIEMLCYAANHCKVEHHMEELRRGGEFLTHVRLLLFNVAHKQKSTKRAIQGEILIPVTTLVSHPCLPSPNQIIID